MKVVATFDAPSCCCDCRVLREVPVDPYLYCMIAKKTLGDLSIIQEWCPLKALPEKKVPYGSDIFNDYINGWNDCVDEILGENND